MTHHETRIGWWLRTVYAGLLVVIGLVLSVGGVALLRYGGSPYYLLAGVATVLAGAWIAMRDPRGPWVFTLVVLATIAWSLFEAGADGWALVPRLVAPLVLAAGLLLPPVRALAVHVPLMPSSRPWQVVGGGVALALVFGFGAHGLSPTGNADPLLRRGTIDTPSGPVGVAGAAAEWREWGGGTGGSRYSGLTQIDASNVARLQPAWTADVGPVVGKEIGNFEATPLMIGNRLYLCNAYNLVVALDPETGRERWRYDMSGASKPSGKPCRGVAYYRVPGATGPCAERIIAASQTPELIALDAATGRPCTGFGQGGRVSLLAGQNKVPFGLYYVSSAPQVIRGKVVVGGGIPDGQYWGGPSGVIRAFDAVTGALSWAFDSGHPRRIGAPPTGQSFTASSPNSWAPISADETLGLVYLPMGNATPDYYGGKRRPLDEAISSSVIALDADTGRLRWRFQTTHHDIWDYDVPSQPTLIDLPTPQGMRPALIQPTKRGEVFVLDRRTGRPILPVEERRVPTANIAAGERIVPTQPFAPGLPSFSGPKLVESDMWGTTPIDQMWCRIRFRQSRYEGTLTPITLGKPVIIDPGYSGGVNWGSVSIDRDHGLMIVNWMRLPNRVELVTRAEADRRGFKLFDGQGPGGSRENPMFDTPYAAIGGPFLSPLGVPCTKPGWGFISAVDLRSGKLVWTKPLGTARDTGPLGIPSMVPLTIGTPMSGGSITTRGGLVFIGAAVEQAIRALDVATGHELWKARLPGGGQATPMTYISPASGRQFVLIAAGGKPSIKSKLSTKVIAFALPRGDIGRQ